MEHHSERFGALRPDERRMMAPRRESGRARGRLNSAEFCYSGRLAALPAATPLFATRSPARRLFCHRTMTFGYAPGALRGPAVGVVEVFLQGWLLRRIRRFVCSNRWFNGPYHHVEHRVDHSVASDDPRSTVDTPSGTAEVGPIIGTSVNRIESMFTGGCAQNRDYGDIAAAVTRLDST